MKVGGWNLVCILALSLVISSGAAEPAPYGAVPNAAQLAWHDIELYGLVCFNMPTFTNEEWAFGDQPAMFMADRIYRLFNQKQSLEKWQRRYCAGIC